MVKSFWCLFQNAGGAKVVAMETTLNETNKFECACFSKTKLVLASLYIQQLSDSELEVCFGLKSCSLRLLILTTPCVQILVDGCDLTHCL